MAKLNEIKKYNYVLKTAVSPMTTENKLLRNIEEAISLSWEMMLACNSSRYGEKCNEFFH